MKKLQKTGEFFSYDIKAESKKDGVFYIPVVDVRDGNYRREQADNINKAFNLQKGSKFIKPTHSLFGLSYNVNEETAKGVWDKIRSR